MTCVHEICASATLTEAGAGVRFEVRTASGSEGAFVVRVGGKVYGYINRCAHVPMELDWNPGEFIDSESMTIMCATHGAMYDPRTGVCVAGPCRGKSLIALQVDEREGRIYWGHSDYRPVDNQGLSLPTPTPGSGHTP